MKSIQKSSTAFVIAMCGLAAPAFAQDALCGGTGTGGQWIGGDEARSDIATADNYLEQMALVLNGNEYVALFSLSEAADVRIEAAGRGAGDPIIDVLDGAGEIILTDDDSGGNGAARGELSLDAGTYCMSLRSYSSGPMTAFVRVGRNEHEALTEGSSDQDVSGPSGSCDTAVPIGPVGTTVSASVDETPFWSFHLDAPTSVSITAENETADPVVTLYDGVETYLEENDDFDGLNSRLDMSEPLPAGDYCIAVNALNDTSLPITVSLTAYDADAALQALYARGEAAPPLDGSIPTTDLGVLASHLRHDAQVTSETTWYTVDIEEAGLVVIEAIAAGSGGDPWIVIYDDLGRELGQNDDYGNGLDSLVTARVDRGKYIIGVKQVDTGSQGFVRLLLERYIRAQ